MKRVVVAASHDLPATLLGDVFAKMRALPPDTEVLLRPSESMIGAFAVALGFPQTYYTTKGARGKVYERDIEMAADADAALLFFSETGMTDHRGTYHLAEALMRAEKPIDAIALIEGQPQEMSY